MWTIILKYWNEIFLSSFFNKLSKAVAGKSKVDDEVLDNLEEVLVTSDVGVNTTLKIIERIEERVAKDKYLGTDELNLILREEIAALLSETNSGEAEEFTIPTDKKPYVHAWFFFEFSVFHVDVQ